MGSRLCFARAPADARKRLKRGRLYTCNVDARYVPVLGALQDFHAWGLLNLLRPRHLGLLENRASENRRGTDANFAHTLPIPMQASRKRLQGEYSFGVGSLSTNSAFPSRKWSLTAEEHSMGSTSDKAAGIANQAVGKAKEGVDKAVGNDRLQAKGASQEAKGKVQKAVGDAKSVVKDATNTTANVIKKNL